jgi:hypothetical protein
MICAAAVRLVLKKRWDAQFVRRLRALAAIAP